MARKFSPPVEELRKIAASAMRSSPESVTENASGNIVLRARYEAAIKRVAKLVRETGGDIVQMTRAGKIRRDAHGSTIGNAQPFMIEFSVGVDEDVFIRTGTRLDARGSSPTVAYGRMVK